MRRRTFLRTGVTAGLVGGLAGCASDTSDDSPATPRTTTEDSATTTEAAQTTEQPEETTDDQPDIDRPANYRWDMRPGRNDLLRAELGQYVEASVGNVVEEHPAFEYSTDSERDDHEIDFAALKLYRDSNFDILKRDSQNPLERWVRAFAEEDLYAEEKHGENFRYNDTEAPQRYSTEKWLNADTVEEALDLGHGLILTIGNPINVPEHAAVTREAFKRYHDFDVLAWETPNQGGVVPSGLMYSPDDDTIRSFDARVSAHSQSSAHFHTPVQDWPFITEGDHHHPLLFHTDEWKRGDVDGFGHAKGLAAGAMTGIADGSNRIDVTLGEEYRQTGEYTVTTGLMEQLTRTTLEYNNNDADFQDLWDFANIAQTLEMNEGQYVIDSGIEDDDYEGIFEGDIAVYEIEDESVVDAVWDDQAGEYDNFGQVYDELDQLSER